MNERCETCEDKLFLIRQPLAGIFVAGASKDRGVSWSLVVSSGKVGNLNRALRVG